MTHARPDFYLRSGRTLLVDLYAATFAQATGRPTLPQPGFPQLGVYVPDGQCGAVETSGETDRAEREVAAHRVNLDELAAHPDEDVTLSDGSTVPEVLGCGALDHDGVIVWSKGSDGLRDGPGRLLVGQLASAAVPWVRHRVCEHPTVADLSRLVAAIGPHQVVAIGTTASGMSPLGRRTGVPRVS